MRRTSYRDHAEHSGRDEDSPNLLGSAACDLLHPLLIRMSGDTRHADAAAFQMNEKQHIVSHQAPPTQHFHAEEVCAGQDVPVSGNEILPRGRLASLRSRSHGVASQNVSHRLIRQAVTQIGQRSDDAIISPASILTRHSHHQSFHVRFNGGAAWIVSVFGTIKLLGDEPSIPSQDGVRLGDAGDLSERFASYTPPDLGEGGALGITQPQSRWQLRPQNPVLRGQIFVLQEKLLVHRSCHVR